MLKSQRCLKKVQLYSRHRLKIQEITNERLGSKNKYQKKLLKKYLRGDTKKHGILRNQILEPTTGKT